ncbi:MAG: hypothetical protein UU73_C0002G0070 [Candidatus Daviesbacteria bacterium GW2011_GWA1_41_61]|uniref:Uncharacterized protein n=1 Tax=Candidatus Daviesbacteria bacterium GW2011_GWA2_40_9 TaxID=1618424 RepID=A0A0G0U119_9BACT|nr:MAG: hypothetical protein UU26_C0039G0006 [Candidatus Daviesbacteria bacterium GW2011_GWC1_40_9]KKR82809.1 MAG: hypothetical protein UU29_C0009G0080 [Candidatus Daviesbacteria bacterium GW2011_GWA2_40_9]KKR93730.1 MAG: hypothetical protein UU44_C0001G0070 [Candidatus Daviesbacteria bacterium GW2011_GWB1_41_15]KKS15196.1 MAG: hypothetical protein UU73_C0002G0070 [Candidatus Daviesbacteria bacterium GW2011_GWA1_41_61]
MIFQTALTKVFNKSYAWVITAAVTFNVLFLYYLILIQRTTWDAFWQSNTTWYVWSQVVLSIINALLIGVTISFLFYVVEERRQGSKSTFLHTLGSLFFSAAVTGCSVCSAFLLPTLGIAASLAAFPFGGLEIKIFSALILLYAIWQYSKSVLGLCEIPKKNLISFHNNKLALNINRKSLSQLQPLLLLVLFIFIVYAIPRLPIKYRAKTQNDTVVAVSNNVSKTQVNSADVFAQINPAGGYEMNATYGNIGPKMLEMGVIDLEKFKQVYQQSGQPLTPEQEEILIRGSDKTIKIDQSNSYFLLNFFWAFGLGNKTKILTAGDMVKYGQGQVGNFASTGGWTLAKGDATDYYSKRALMPFTAEQEELVNKVASNIYRPCCGNSTAFPDCNHGMALLGILELMAANGATEDEMYEAAKYINAFWFPGNYYDIALYFKNKEGKDYKDIDARLVLSKDISSAFGAQTVKKWLTENGIVEPPPSQGGGCGV